MKNDKILKEIACDIIREHNIIYEKLNKKTYTDLYQFVRGDKSYNLETRTNSETIMTQYIYIKSDFQDTNVELFQGVKIKSYSISKEDVKKEINNIEKNVNNLFESPDFYLFKEINEIAEVIVKKRKEMHSIILDEINNKTCSGKIMKRLDTYYYTAEPGFFGRLTVKESGSKEDIAKRIVISYIIIEAERIIYENRLNRQQDIL